MAERSKRHHYVPQLLLRGFADEDERLLTVDRTADRTFIQPVLTAAAENDYNTISAVPGVPRDLAEKAIAELEGPAGPILKRIRAGGWLAHPRERVHVARFLAYQYVRVPRQRQFATEVADKLLKLQIAAGGPAALRDVMQKEGSSPTDGEVLERWKQLKDFDSWETRLPTERHLVTGLQLIDEIAPMLIHGFHWTVVRWQLRSMLTSDNPVMLEAPADKPPWSGVGIATASTISLALDRRCVLVLVHKTELPVLKSRSSDLPDGQSVRGTAAHARWFNYRTAAQARRFVYHHPQDQLDRLIGPGVELPPVSPHLDDPDNGRDLRDSLVAAGEWAFAHPDEPHPLAGVPAPVELPPNARPLASGRGDTRLRLDLEQRLGRLD